MKTQSQHPGGPKSRPSPTDPMGAETIAVHQIVKLSNVTWILHTPK